MSATKQSELPPDVTSFLRDWLGPAWTATGLAGDASVRAYFRVATEKGASYMLAYYPESVREGLVRFLSAYRAIEKHASVPLVHRHGDYAVIQDDVGDVTLFDVLREERERGIELYRAAIDLLVAFQKAPPEAQAINPPFDLDRFYSELLMTRDFYVEKLQRQKADEKLLEYFHEICSEITSHPYALCHRDYHGQNLHLHSGTVYMIDYQDLRMGPDTYDLASLLRDRGVARILGRATELELLRYYAENIGADESIRERYFLNLLQRSIKVLGTFARQAVERGRTHYLEFIPPALESIEVCMEEVPRFAPLRELFPMSFDVGTTRE